MSIYYDLPYVPHDLIIQHLETRIYMSKFIVKEVWMCQLYKNTNTMNTTMYVGIPW